MDLTDKIESYWNKEVEDGGMYTVPCLHLTRDNVEKYAHEQIDGSPDFPVFPRSLLKDVRGKEVLCLASGGGQQSAVFGLLGAQVTSLDISEGQLRGDKAAAVQR